MTSGRKLTMEQADAILRLAGETDEDGNWRLTYRQIAEKTGFHRHTVYRLVRRVAVLCCECALRNSCRRV